MPACDLQCDRQAGCGRLRCCRKRICDRCVTQVLQLNYQRQRWHIACSFCRHVTAVTEKRVKQLLCDHVPDHAKVIASDIGPVAIVHNPGPDGRYDSRSSIDMLPTDLPGVVDELMEEVEDLQTKLAEERAIIKRLGQSWRGQYNGQVPSSGDISILGFILSQSPRPDADGPRNT